MILQTITIAFIFFSHIFSLQVHFGLYNFDGIIGDPISTNSLYVVSMSISKDNFIIDCHFAKLNIEIQNKQLIKEGKAWAIFEWVDPASYSNVIFFGHRECTETEKVDLVKRYQGRVNNEESVIEKIDELNFLNFLFFKKSDFETLRDKMERDKEWFGEDAKLVIFVEGISFLILLVVVLSVSLKYF
eukprot:GAHX01000303.1.p1 GENE.GAHX01000303.1~~GAHX01000303.1.p1  ORF type:complete len:187 (+),score=39.85 GAHX01000303.1:312-872(+)